MGGPVRINLSTVDPGRVFQKKEEEEGPPRPCERKRHAQRAP